MFLCVCVRRNSSERLWILLDPYKKSWHSQDENVMPINLKKLTGIIIYPVIMRDSHF